MGETFLDAPAFAEAIADDPVTYSDGTAVYLIDDGSGSSGWSISYGGVPVNVSYETVEAFEAAILLYDIPVGTPTYIEDTGGFVTVDESGSGVPVETVIQPCTNPRSDVDMYAISGQGDDSNMEAPLVLTDLISTPTVP
jgi:hypothetical protein